MAQMASHDRLLLQLIIDDSVGDKNTRHRADELWWACYHSLVDFVAAAPSFAEKVKRGRACGVFPLEDGAVAWSTVQLAACFDRAKSGVTRFLARAKVVGIKPPSGLLPDDLGEIRDWRMEKEGEASPVSHGEAEVGHHPADGEDVKQIDDSRSFPERVVGVSGYKEQTSEPLAEGGEAQWGFATLPWHDFAPDAIGSSDNWWQDSWGDNGAWPWDQ